MTVTVFSSRKFNQDRGSAKKATAGGPVFITDRGRPKHVLLSFESYLQLTEGGESLIERLGLPEGVEDIALEIPDVRDVPRPADFS